MLTSENGLLANAVVAPNTAVAANIAVICFFIILPHKNTNYTRLKLTINNHHKSLYTGYYHQNVFHSIFMNIECRINEAHLDSPS